MVASLPPADLRKLIGILGMLGSDFPGERSAAGLLAARMLREHDLTWETLLTPNPETRRQAPGGSQDGAGSRWADSDDLTTCLKWLGELNAWETSFVTDLRRKRRPLSSAQKAKLEQIAGDLRARGRV